MYTGLPSKLRKEVLERDNWRCRWCGRTNAGLDLHHIRYRRGEVDDVADNLVSLCRLHHNYVHGLKVATDTITKSEAQQILRTLVQTPGQTGLSEERRLRRGGPMSPSKETS